VAVPLAVWVGLNDPQAPVLPQVTVQSTPPAVAESFTTAAVIAVFVPACSDAGGAVLSETEIAGGGGGGVVEVEPPPHPTQPDIEATQINGRSTHCLIVTADLLRICLARVTQDSTLDRCESVCCGCNRADVGRKRPYPKPEAMFHASLPTDHLPETNKSVTSFQVNFGEHVPSVLAGSGRNPPDGRRMACKPPETLTGRRNNTPGATLGRARRVACSGIAVTDLHPAVPMAVPTRKLSAAI